MLARGRELGLQRLDDAIELGMDLGCVGLVEDRAQQREHPRLRGLGHFRGQVAGVVGPAPLPTRSRQGGLDRRHQPGVRIRGDQRDPGQASGDQRAQERQPTGAVLTRHDVEPEDLALAVGGDPDRDQGVHDHRAAVLADLLGQRVQPQERVRAGVQRPRPERLDLGVEALGHLRDLRLRQRGDAQLGDQLLHPAGRDPEQVAGGHHRDQGLLSAAASLQQPLREV
jgi:hypothetical protein